MHFRAGVPVREAMEAGAWMGRHDGNAVGGAIGEQNFLETADLRHVHIAAALHDLIGID